MLRQTKSYLLLFVVILLIIFLMHFAMGMLCRANPDPKVSDRFDAYLKPGLLVLLAPFLFLSKLLTNGWGHGDVLGFYVYFGAMLVYSVLWTIALLGIYEVLRKAITWKHRDKLTIHHPTGFSSGGQ